MSDKLSDNLSSMDDEMVPDIHKEAKMENVSNNDSLDDDELNDDVNVKQEIKRDELDSELSDKKNSDLDNLSEISDDYLKDGQKQTTKIDDFLDDEQSDDYGNDSKKEQERIKKEKKLQKRRRQLDREQKQPRMSEKENQQMLQEKMGDDEADLLMQQMKQVYEKDLKAQIKGHPYINKILFCNEILNKLNNTYVRKSFSEDQGLSELYRWFKQAQKDQSLTLIKKIIKIIQKMDMTSDNISTSALVRDFAKKRHQIVHNMDHDKLLDKEAETSIVSMIDSWAPLFIRSRYDQNNEYQDMEDDLKGEVIEDDQY